MAAKQERDGLPEDVGKEIQPEVSGISLRRTAGKGPFDGHDADAEPMDQRNERNRNENGARQGRRYNGASGDRVDVPCVVVSGVYAGTCDVVSRVSERFEVRKTMGYNIQRLMVEAFGQYDLITT